MDAAAEKKAGYTLAVFNATHGAELVVFRNSLDGAKAECVFQLDLMLPSANRVEAFRVISGWHYRIAHEGRVVEEGKVEMMPCGRIAVR